VECVTGEWCVAGDDDFSKELKKAKDRVKDERRNDKKRSRSVLDIATLSKQHQIVSFTYNMCM